MKKTGKYFLTFLLGLLVIFIITISLPGCSEEDLESVACAGECGSSLPWSYSGASNCYDTKSHCQGDTGHTCYLCN